MLFTKPHKSWKFQFFDNNVWATKDTKKIEDTILESSLKLNKILFEHYKSWQISSMRKTAASLFPFSYETFLIGILLKERKQLLT
jgi:hypothetical protein